MDFDNSKIKIDPTLAAISQKTIDQIVKAWHESGNAPPKINPDVPEEDKIPLRQLIAECIKEEGGEISRQAKVVHLAMIYINLTMKGKEVFLRILARDFDVDTDILDVKIRNLKKTKNEEERIAAELDLSEAIIPPRTKALRQMITLPNGFIFLKDMRRDLLPMIKSAPRLQKLDIDIQNILTSYFDVNLLELQEISWDSPASLLERLMKYEAVHDITSWNDLKHRLFTDHRVFGFFHTKMPNDPLIFVEVALVNGMADNIQKLIDVNEVAKDPNQADTAIFYSISSTQKGLKGISFGNFLIKRVVKKLTTDFPNLKTFATLSPIPLFRKWLTDYLENGGPTFFKAEEADNIIRISGDSNAALGLLEILDEPKWHMKKRTCASIKNPLMRLCAHYLFNVKNSDGLRAFDPVANFHLSNGSKIEHIHWLADISQKGIKQSAGIMLNYHYRLDKIVINHENFMSSGTVHASSDAKKWLK